MSVYVCVCEEEEDIFIQGLALSKSGFLVCSDGPLEPSAKMEVFCMYLCSPGW